MREAILENKLKPYAFLLRLPRSAVSLFCWPAVSRLFFNAAKIINDLASAPWRQRDGFDFLAFDFFLDHGERTLAIFVSVALGLEVRR